MVRGGSLLIMRFVGQRSRSQLLKIEQKFDTFFVSARYIKNGISDLIKGNNKITELRTIFQRESQNS